ncbi:MAG TPA: CheR family methyltransferase [Pseudonocardiaceae bacterium]
MTDAEGTDDGLEELLHFIRDARGFDFTGYKRSSISRRIRKRMQDVAIKDFLDYRDLLESSAEEFQYLFNTILINVTAFFRDTESWNYLQREVVPDLLACSDPADEIRLWSAGCSTGEEAYSLAIVLAEALGIDECIRRVKIYATDVDEEALHEARTGTYPAKSLESLSEDLRTKYFEPLGARYTFRGDLRRRVIFGRHDITRDAPISRLDLLVCRNALMYFNVEAQAQIIDRFHFAIRENGYLFLGKAEMLLADGGRFEIVNMRQRVFRRRSGVFGASPQPTPMRMEAGVGVELREVGRKRQMRDLAMEAAPYAMLGVGLDGAVSLVNAQMRAQFGLTSHDVGKPLRDLEISYRPTELRSLIEQAQAEHRTIRVNAVERRPSTDDIQFFDILVQPLWADDGLAVGVAVVFMDTTHATRLALEVKRNREELETAYEELQSTNEELETTNEELQSGNEELETMNEEMRIRTNELDEVRTYLQGVLSSVGAGVVVLGSDLRVRSWNRGAEELWGLRADEVQQQDYFSLDFGLPGPTVRDLVKQCLESRRQAGPVTIEAVNRIGRTIRCSLLCSPLDSQPEGVVLMMEEQRSV